MDKIQRFNNSFNRISNDNLSKKINVSKKVCMNKPKNYYNISDETLITELSKSAIMNSKDIMNQISIKKLYKNYYNQSVLLTPLDYKLTSLYKKVYNSKHQFNEELNKYTQIKNRLRILKREEEKMIKHSSIQKMKTTRLAMIKKAKKEDKNMIENQNQDNYKIYLIKKEKINNTKIKRNKILSSFRTDLTRIKNNDFNILKNQENSILLDYYNTTYNNLYKKHNKILLQNQLRINNKINQKQTEFGKKVKKSKELIGKLEKEKKKRLRLKSEIDNIKEECNSIIFKLNNNNNYYTGF